MKRVFITQSIIATSMILVMAVAHADSITYPDPATFTAGQTLTTNSLNDKFDETKRAVNENDARITGILANGTGNGGGDITSVTTGLGLKNIDVSNGLTGDIILEIDATALKTQIDIVVQSGLDAKQNKILGTCDTKQKMIGVLADGGANCIADNDTNTTYRPGRGLKLTNTTFTPANGTVAIHAYQFHGSNNNSNFTQAQGFAFFIGAIQGNPAFFQASIQLPHNATVTGVQCYVYDNSSVASITHVKMTRRRHDRSAIHGDEMVAIFPLAPANSTTVNKISSTAVSFATVNNAIYSYYFDIRINDASAGSFLRLNSCSVNYSY